VIGLVVVTVLLCGVPVPASRPARVQAAVVVVPIDPFVLRIAREVTIDPPGGWAVIRRGAREVRVRLAAGAGGDGETAYVPLATVVRGLGGSIVFDAVRKVAAIEMPGPGPIVTPTPYDPSNPTVPPRSIFTPEPTVTPRPTLSGIPQPRRTPLEVVPSFPLR